MPFKRLYKRKPMRKYKAKPKSVINRSLKAIQNYIHPVVTCSSGQFTLNTTNGFTFGAGANTSLQFQFTQNTIHWKLGGTGATGTFTNFANASSLANVYDAYRLKKVVCSWIFSNNSSPLTNTAHTLPILYTVIDKDDSNSLASSQIALAYSDCKITQLGNQRGDGAQYITLYSPMTESDVTTTTGTFVSSQRTANAWMDTDETSPAYNGIKMFVEFPGSTSSVNVGTISLFFRCYFEYKENH
ncbi:VP1 [Chicken proventriculitis-associated circular virus 17]|nr:VP1 [Chicken proventriculitis-associated circular virus 17]